MASQNDKEQLLIEFNDVHYYEDVIIRKDELVRLIVTIQESSGRFEVSTISILLCLVVDCIIILYKN